MENTKKTIYQSRFATLYLDEKIPAISEEWHGSASVEEFQSLLQTKLELFGEHKQKFSGLKWIANVSGLKVGNEAKNWANQLFHRQLHSAGVSHIAFIVPSAVYADLSDDYQKEKMDAQQEITLKYFGNYDDASEWLRNVESQSAN